MWAPTKSCEVLKRKWRSAVWYQSEKEFWSSDFLFPTHSARRLLINVHAQSRSMKRCKSLGLWTDEKKLNTKEEKTVQKDETDNVGLSVLTLCIFSSWLSHAGTFIIRVSLQACSLRIVSLLRNLTNFICAGSWWNSNNCLKCTSHWSPRGMCTSTRLFSRLLQQMSALVSVMRR